MDEALFQSQKAELSDLIKFVPAKSGNESKRKKKSVRKFNGTDIKEFYEELVGSTSHEQQISLLDSNSYCGLQTEDDQTTNIDTDGIATNSFYQTTQQKSSKKSSPSVNEFLTYANHGNLKGIQMCLKNGMDINCCDTFGWSALMCSAHAGHEEVVKILLKEGINCTITDRLSRDAVALAQRSGHTGIACLIDHHHVKKRDKDERKPSGLKTNNTRQFFCSVCKSEFKDSTVKSHESSTVHLFNLKLKPKPDSYLIPPSNVGFKLMLKNGWDGQAGLGPEGQGHRYPIRTVLKRDRTCLGSEANHKKKARVTHFNPNDSNAVKFTADRPERRESLRSLSKKAQREKVRRDKNWERNLRYHMSYE